MLLMASLFRYTAECDVDLRFPRLFPGVDVATSFLIL